MDIGRRLSALASLAVVVTTGRAALVVGSSMLATLPVLACQSGESDFEAKLALRYRTQDGGSLLLEISPFKVGENRFRISAFDDRDEPVGLVGATLRVSRLDQDAPTTEVASRQATDGARTEAAALLNSTGWWEFQVAVGQAASVSFYVRLDRSAEPPLEVAAPDYQSDPEAEQLYDGALRTYEGLATVKSSERLTSGLLAPTGIGAATLTTAEAQAPDRLHYRLRNPGSTEYEVYKVGETSCNRDAGQRWRCSPGEALEVFALNYLNPTAFKLGRREQVDGEMTRVLLFYNPGQPAWYSWWVGEETGFLRRQAMVAPGHYMLTHYLEHNQPVAIELPQEAQAPGG